MTIHYHGTPITPGEYLDDLAGRCFCVSFAAGYQVRRCHEIGQSVMLDNGAFSLWRRGKPVNWPKFYDWVEPWLDFHTSWGVIPDVIDGSEEENDELIAQWPFGDSGAPVWHMNESIDRLKTLCDGFSKVCIGSSGEYQRVGTPDWKRRMEQVLDELCGNGPPPRWLHMLRGFKVVEDYPFASADSTAVVQNYRREWAAHLGVVGLADRYDARQGLAAWSTNGRANGSGLTPASPEQELEEGS